MRGAAPLTTAAMRDFSHAAAENFRASSALAAHLPRIFAWHHVRSRWSAMESFHAPTTSAC
jgi:hypothetical protein